MPTKIATFEYWVQRTLPQVYDDSLSFYELLNKVVQKLNEMGVTVNELIDLYESITDYIDEKLIEEIKRKLDEMVADGTLADIINEQIFGELNDKIDQLCINVKSFGAVGDGVTDDTIAIQEAIDSSPGGKLFFPKGVYLVTSPLQLSSSSLDKFRPVTKVYGDGMKESTILNGVMGRDRAVLEWNQTVDQATGYLFGLGVVIEDIEIKGQPNTTSNGVKVEGVFFLEVNRAYIHNHGTHGLYFPYDSDLEASAGGGAGDDAYLTGYTKINNCFIQANGQFNRDGCGIYSEKLSATMMIQNNHITDNFGWGVRVSTRELIVERNAISNNGKGDGATYYGGLFLRRATSVTSSALPHSNRFAHNEFDGNYGIHLDLYSCGHSILEGLMIIPRVIDKAVIPNTYRSSVGIRLGGAGSSQAVYNDILRPAFRVADFDNGGDPNNDPTFIGVKVEASNYGNRVVNPLVYGSGSSKFDKILDLGFSNEWVEAGKLTERTGYPATSPIVIARQPSPGAIPHNTITALTWTSEQMDNYVAMENGVFTLPYKGVVSVKGFITLTAPLPDKDFSVFLYVNGASNKRLFYKTKGMALETIPFDFGMVQMSSGTVDMRVFHNAGVDLNINTVEPQYSNLEITSI
jgi:hypothetical protein